MGKNTANMGKTMNQKISKTGCVYYSIVKSALGELLVAVTKKGICSVKMGDNADVLEREIKNKFCSAIMTSSYGELNSWIREITDYLEGDKKLSNLPYDIEATAFQHRVWEYLRSIQLGNTRHYSEVACALSIPKAARAVAKACAANPVALIIPCHRVLPKSGKLGEVGGYRWHPMRKKKLLEIEKKLAYKKNL